jgi:coenzyme F420-0:L-glutamate ligase/coenzyme F420-1:gamma-L-glutamate ligase
VDDGIRVLPLLGLPEVRAGDDLAALLLAAAPRAPVGGLRDGDVLVVTHKVVAKAEGCAIDLRTVEPSAFARAIAERWDKDARQVEVVLRESARIVRMDRGVLICETRHGYVCANAGVDRSNVPGDDTVLMLPLDPDASARAIRARLRALTGVAPGIVITDSFGRAWRSGQSDIAIGLAGVAPLDDWRGRADANGREMHATVIAVGDLLAATADLARRKDASQPVVLIRGAAEHVTEADGPGVRPLLRERQQDLFR